MFHQSRGGNVDTNKFYELLGVDKTASEKEIKSAFRRKARDHHPDKGGDGNLFKEINKAYEVLSDPEKKQIYDQYGEEGLENGGGAGPDMSDIFGSFFGGGMRQGRRGPTRGDDISFESNVTLEQFYSGHKKPLRLTRKCLCKACGGRGGEAGSVQTCDNCKGRGIVTRIQQMGPGMIQQFQTTCNVCNGEGEIIPERSKCKECKGAKVVKEKEILELFIDPGMSSNEQIRFKGKADEAPNTIPGDLVVVLKQSPHPVFERKGRHLVMTKEVTLLEALSGFEFTFTHLDNRRIRVKSPKGTVIKPGDVKVLHSEGMPVHRSPFQKGDLYIVFSVKFPDFNEIQAGVNDLSKILPGPSSNDSDVDMEVNEEREIMDAPSDFKSKIAADERMDKQSSRSRGDATEEDHDEGHGHQQANCRTM